MDDNLCSNGKLYDGILCQIKLAYKHVDAMIQKRLKAVDKKHAASSESAS
jgi:hypothetical protein